MVVKRHNILLFLVFFRMFRLLVTLALIATPVLSYSAGAPSGACGDGVPQHHTEAQKSAAPYDIILSKNKIRSGESVQVTIKGKTPEDTFKGLLVQAKVGDTSVGKFDVAPSDKFIQLLNCGNGKGVSEFLETY